MTFAVARGALRALAFPALAVILLVGAPRLAGWQTYALSSGSMQPAIQAGSVVILRPAAVAELAVGEVVGVRTPRGVLIHRIVAIGADGSLTLKGDANDVVDGRPWPVESVVGTVAYSVPLAGYVVLLVQDPPLGSIPMLALVVSLALLARPQAQRFTFATGFAAIVALSTLAPAVAPFSAASASGQSDVRTDRLLPASGLAGNAAADGVALSWTVSPSASVQYLVERCMGSGCTSFAPLVTLTGTQHLDETVDRRTWYGYRVAASYAGWTSAYTAAIWVRAR